MAHSRLTPRATLIEAGEFAPEFTLLDTSRNEWKLSEAVKKGDVVICFFPFAFTGVCGTEMHCVSKEIANWSAKGAQVVGLSCDSTFTLGAWVKAEGYQQPMLSDQHREVCKAFGLHWLEMNTTHRGTVIIGQSDDGKGRVTFSQSREPGNAMNFGDILAMIS